MKRPFDTLIKEEDYLHEGGTPPVEAANNYTPIGVIKQEVGAADTEINIVGEPYTDGGIKYVPTSTEPIGVISDLPTSYLPTIKTNGTTVNNLPMTGLPPTVGNDVGNDSTTKAPIEELTDEGSTLLKNNKKTAIIIIAVIALIFLGSFLSK